MSGSDGRADGTAPERVRALPRCREAAGVRRRDDGGFATVWTAGAMTAILVVVTAMMWLGAAIVTRHRAAAAADLAALAAAGRASEGVHGACRTATTVTERMQAELSSCELKGADALVEVTVDPGGALAQFARSTAHARAGPVDLRSRLPAGRSPPG